MTSPATTTPSRIIEEPGVGRVEVFSLSTEETFLHGLLTDVFENWWRDIAFGTLVQGAVFEIHIDEAPRRIGLLDGYLTVDLGGWHFHVCIGLNKGTKRNPTSPDLAVWRRTARAEMIRVLNSDDSPRSWQLRLFNGQDENQITVFFPSPFLGPNDKILKTPDWSRLEMWDSFQRRYLGNQPDPRDRAACGFPCGGH